MVEIKALPQIADVYTAHFRTFGDNRGRFAETFRSEWFPQVDWRKLQMNRSESDAHVLRGLHYHFKQLDYWCVQSGTIRVGLADLRPQSPTYLASCTFDLNPESGFGVLIPIGVAHGFYALTPVIITYLVNNYYDSRDEFGVAWNDPTLNVPWGVSDPQLSGRDAQNRPLTAIGADELPH
jgi:dTDP-4-dehydrorhamnose 3,5-epimerase